MKSKKMIFLFSSFLAVGIIIQFADYDFILNYLKNNFSSDGIIEKSTYLNYKSKFVFVKMLSIFFPFMCLILLVFPQKIVNIINYINTNSPKLIHKISSKINIIRLFWFAIIAILILSIYSVYMFDVGQDEAFYLNDIQNIDNYGYVYRDDGNASFYYDIPNLPLNIIANITVPLFGFSVNHIRFIVLLFALMTIPFLFTLFDKNTSQILIPILFLFPGIFSLTSTVFLEFTSLFFVVLSLVLLKKFENSFNKKFIILSAFFMAISMAVKIQLVLWLGLILLVLFIIEHKNNALLIFNYGLMIIVFYLFLLAFAFVHYGFHNGVLLFKYVFLGGNTSSTFNINLSLIINKLMMLNNLIYAPFLLFIWVKTWRIIKEKYNRLFMKIIFIGAIIIVIHWCFFFNVLTWRNVFIGISFNCILFALFLTKNYKNAKIILLPYVAFGIVANLAFIQNGVNNDVQLYNAHLLDTLIDTKQNTDQRIFFDEVSQIVQDEDDVYVPLQPYISRIFLKDRTIKKFSNYEQSNGNQYVIITAGALIENYVKKMGMREILTKSEIILNIGNYTLYKLP